MLSQRMGMRFMTAIAIANIAFFAGTSSASVTEYKVAIWYPTTMDTINAMYRPLFESYLNRVIDSGLNIRFKTVVVDLEEKMLVENLIENNQLDFVFSMAGRIACIEKTYDWVVVASARNRVLGKEIGSQGTVLYSLKTNSAIKSIQDFKGKRIGVAHIQSGSFYVGKQVLADHGIDLYRDTAQLVFYGNAYADQLNHVLMGKLDAAITASTFIPQKYPDQLPNLVFHSLMNASYESELYPLQTSSWLTPGYSVACSPKIPFTIKAAVAEALENLSPNFAEAKAGSLSNFTTPASHFDVRAAMEEANLFDSNGRCLSPFGQMSSIMRCPPGFVLDTDKGLERRCEFNKLTCPTGYPCYCSPCIASISVSLFPAEVVLGLATTLFCLNLAVVVFWGFGIEVCGCCRKPARALAMKTQEVMVRRRRPMSLPAHR